MSSLALPIQPENLRMSRKIPVDADVFHICDRVKELDPRLYIYALDPPVTLGEHVFYYSVCERCADGIERLVCRVSALDGRLIEKLQYLLHVPFEKRFAEAERIEAKAEAERQDEELNKLYEQMGRPMLTDLERCGFISRPTSYAKRGVKAK